MASNKTVTSNKTAIANNSGTVGGRDAPLAGTMSINKKISKMISSECNDGLLLKA